MQRLGDRKAREFGDNRMLWLAGFCLLGAASYFGFDLVNSLRVGAVHAKFGKIVLEGVDPGLFWFDIAFYTFGVCGCFALAFFCLRTAYSGRKR
jgi:hypothetical protein